MERDYFLMLNKILEKSKDKNGANKPVTIGHFHNMTKLAIKLVDGMEERNDVAMQERLNEIWEDQHKYGTN